ncbi:MAG: hypothetical protein U0X87_11390 [Anaerolineales bacterium]
MEFRKPKWDEAPNEGDHGHDWKIFPLLHRRYLFADVENFFLFDLFTANGRVDENVFAYSNIHQDERGLVLYHNRFADTKGWIKTSAAYLDKSTGDLRQKSSPKRWDFRLKDLSSSKIMSRAWNTSARARNCGTKDYMLNCTRISITCLWIGGLPKVTKSGATFMSP